MGPPLGSPILFLNPNWSSGINPGIGMRTDGDVFFVTLPSGAEPGEYEIGQSNGEDYDVAAAFVLESDGSVIVLSGPNGPTGPHCTSNNPPLTGDA